MVQVSAEPLLEDTAAHIVGLAEHRLPNRLAKLFIGIRAFFEALANQAVLKIRSGSAAMRLP